MEVYTNFVLFCKCPLDTFVCLYITLGNTLITPTFTSEFYLFAKLREYYGPKSVPFQSPCLFFGQL